jgi:hypothetical protein
VIGQLRAEKPDVQAKNAAHAGEEQLIVKERSLVLMG